jgi:hypothetical protein
LGAGGAARSGHRGALGEGFFLGKKSPPDGGLFVIERQLCWSAQAPLESVP